jgi:hypothetical protein
MSTTHEHGDPAAEPAGMTLETDGAKATTAEITAQDGPATDAG